MSETSDATDGSHSPLTCRMSHKASTVWLPDSRLLYAGMSGRKELDPESVKRKGLWTRLDSHASGQRSGDNTASMSATGSSSRHCPPTTYGQSVTGRCYSMR
jgi:hypothetical protein